MTVNKHLIFGICVIVIILVISVFIYKEKYDDRECAKCRKCVKDHPNQGIVNLVSEGCYDVDVCNKCE